MRGPHDDRIERLRATARTGAEGTLPAPRPSKALIRLTQLLERSGHEDHATRVLIHALPENRRGEFEARSRQFTASPARIPGTPERPLPRGTDRTLIAESLALAHAAAAERLTSAPPSAVRWQSLGPIVITNGQTYGSSRIHVSGRVSAVAIDPSDSRHILAGAANGGVWESADGGATWSPRTDSAPTLTVGALTFDPTNASVVYCGTGEGNWWWFLGQGILQSQDKGTTWAVMCTAPFVGQGFYDLAVNPANGQQLIAGTTGGLYLSNNGGTVWTNRRSVPTWSISAQPTEMLAACADGVFGSTNGASWSPVLLPGAPSSFARAAVRTASSDPTIAYLWAANSNSAFLWRRRGGVWTALNPPSDVQLNQAWYDWFLAVDPQRSEIVYCGAIDAHRGDASGAQVQWTNLSTKGGSGDSIHPDQHAISIDPNNPDTLYVGNDGGLFRTDDAGVHWSDCNNGLVISEFEYLAHDPGSSQWLIGGTQDNGTDRRTGAPIWEHVADGDGGGCGVNVGNPNIVFHTFYYMSLERSTTKGDWNSWTSIDPPAPSAEGSLFYPPFRCGLKPGNTIAMGGDAVYVSRDNGDNWIRLAFPAAARSSALCVPSPDEVYVGTTDGRVFKTSWAAGPGWTALSPLSTPRAKASIAAVLIDSNSPGRIWVTSQTIGGGRVFRSENDGLSWTDCSAGLPQLPVNAVDVDPQDSNRVWVAADLGVYETRDAGSTWTTMSQGLPNAFVGDLLFHAQSRLLRAATRNRGVWEIQLS